MTNTNENLPAKTPGMSIKNLCPGLMEVGKIKIGMKGEERQGQNGTWQLPQKVDHFIITTMERGQDNNFIRDAVLHEKYGDEPREIKGFLLYDDPALNFPTRYACYYGKTLFCYGDGETASRLDQNQDRHSHKCPCERLDPKYSDPNKSTGTGRCKVNGCLSFVIDGAEIVGGVWKFRTTSYNSAIGLLSSMALIKRMTGGRLAGIPLSLKVAPKAAINPIDGKPLTVYVVWLQFNGTPEKLREIGYQIAMDEATHGIRVQEIEVEARKLLAHEPDGDVEDALGSDTAEEIVGEFYPEQAAAEAGDSYYEDQDPPQMVNPEDERQTETEPASLPPEQEQQIESEKPDTKATTEPTKPEPQSAKKQKKNIDLF